VKASAKDEKQNAAACFENQKPYLVGGIPTYPSEKSLSSSVGMMTFPTEWKFINNVPNHQPDMKIAIEPTKMVF